MNYRSSLRVAGVFLFAFFLAGCPSSDDDGSSSLDVDTADEPVTQGVTLVSEATELDTGSSDRVTLSATVRDEENRVLTEEPVEFKAEGDVFLSAPDDATTAGSGTVLTDARGVANYDVRAGESDFNNRQATVIAETAQGSRTLRLDIVGTSIGISGSGSVPIDQTVDYTIEITDGSGNGIPNEDIEVSVSNGLLIDDNDSDSIEKTTDSNGRFDIAIQGLATSADTATITASATALDSDDGSLTVSIPAESLTFIDPDAGTLLPVNEDNSITVFWEDGGTGAVGREADFTINRGDITTAATQTTDGAGEAQIDIQSGDAGPVRVEAQGTSSDGTLLETSRTFSYVGTVPDSIELRANPTGIVPGGESTLRARVRDSSGNPVAESTVEFSIPEGDDGSNGADVSPNTVDTNERGIATATVTGGPEDSGKDGLKLRARIQDDPGIEDTTAITVDADAFSISLGTGNTIEAPTATDYRQPWSVFVTDSTGGAVADQEVRIEVIPIGYRKGAWIATTDGWATFGGLIVNDGAGGEEELEPGEEDSVDEDDILSIGAPLRCISSDLELDDPLLDGVSLFDTNTQVGVATPTDVAAQKDLVTDSEGRAAFDLNYPKSEAPWVTVRIEATIQGDGFDQTTRSRSRDLRLLADDVNDTSVEPPGGADEGAYGRIQDCDELG